MPIKFLNTVAVDTSVLYVDTINDRVGIGTATPSTLLQLSSNNPILTLTDTESTYRYAGLALTTNGGSWNLSNGDSTTAANSNLYITRNSDGTDNRFIFHRDSYYFGVYDNTNTIKTVIRANGNSYFNGGNVGIGTTSPSSLLHLSSAGSTVLNIEATGANDSRLRITAGNSNISYVEFADPDDVDTGEIRYEHATNNMQFRTAGNTEQMRIDSTGNVGIGTDNPSEKLHVSGNARVTGAYYDTNNSPGTSGQVLSSTATGTDWIDQGDIIVGEADKAKSVVLRVKNSTASAMTKGQVICEAVSASPPSGNLIEVALADNNGTNTMPALGILNEDLDAAGGANDEGDAIMFGKVSGIDTSAFSVGDEVFVSDTPGGLTITKPTGVKYIQKVGVVIRDDNTNGTIEVFGAGRVNDVPTPLYVDHANQRLGIGATSPVTKLDVYGTSDTYLTVRNNGGGYKAGIRMYGGSAGISHIWHDDTETDPPGIRFGTSANTATTPTTQLYIKGSNGNVGIGTTSPNFKTHLYDTGNTVLGITAGTANYTTLQFGSTSDTTRGAIEYYTGDDSLRLKTGNNNERMRIDSTGKVGIGTTNPLAALDVNSNVHIDTYAAGTTVAHDAGYIKLLCDAKTGWAPGDELGKIEFYSTDASGIGTRNAASIRAVNNQGNGSSTTTFEGELAFYTSLYNTAEAEAVRIDSAGNVGIGTTSPDRELEVEGAGNVYIRATSRTDNDSTALELKNTQETWTIINDDTNDDALEFQSDGGTQVTILKAGNVGIGTTNPRVPLQVSSNEIDTDFLIESGSAQARMSINNTSTGDSQINFQLGNASKFTIGVDNSDSDKFKISGSSALGSNDRIVVDSSGNVGIGTTSPEKKLHISSSDQSTARIRITNTGNSGDSFDLVAGVNNVTQDGFSIFNATASATYFVIQGGGNVGIGTTSPSQKLHVSGNARVTGAYYDSNNSAGGSGDVLSSTVTGTEWVSGGGGGGITAVTAGTNLNGGATSGNATLNLDSAIELTSVQYGSGVTLSESSDRADLLYVNSSTSTWGGLQIGNTSNEFIFSLMGDGNIGGIYDDQNSDWLIQWNENSEVRLYHNAAERLNTSSSGVTITGDLTVTGGDIVLSGTGRIQGVDTVSSGTDATNKTYVDNAIAGVPQGDITAVTAGTNLTGGGTSGAVTLNMATGGIGSGTYGSTADGTKIDNITVDAYGRVTAITTGATGSGNGTVTGSGTTNYVSKWTSSTAQGNSTIYDNGNVGIGTTSPGETLTLQTQATGLGSEGIFIKNPFAGSSPIVNSKSPFLSLATSNTSAYNSTIYMGRNATATNQESKIEWSNANEALSIYVAGQGSYREHVRFGNLSSGTPRTYFGGNVGIGTTSPATDLEIEGGDHLLQLSTTSSTGSPYLSFNQAGTRRSFIQHNDSGDTLKLASEYGGIDFYTGTFGSETEKMTIQSDGDVGINVTSPSSKLHVRKAAGPLSSFNSNTIGIFETNGPGYVNIVTGTTSTGELWFSDNLEGRGRVRYNHSIDELELWVSSGKKADLDGAGNLSITGSLSQNSDAVLKENVEDIDEALDKVKQLRGVEFNMIGNDRKELGVIAQEVEKVLPELVTEKDGIRSVAYGNITAVLIEAIKEQQSQIDKLKNQVELLRK